MNPVDSIYALLFVAEAPVPLSSLATTLGFTEGQTEQVVDSLAERLSQSGAIQLLKISGGYQLSTKTEYSEIIAAFLRPQPQRLSRSLLETLAIVAYRQPVTLAEIEVIRGVQCDYSVRTLVDRGLLEEVGKKAAPGRPSLYGTTAQFLHQFKLNDLTQLPELQTSLPFPSEPVAEEA
jgi:segregation and condensation protein B